MEDKQVTLAITTDYGFTADFLRELANQIEEQGEQLTTYETFRGCAEVEWPDADGTSEKHRIIDTSFGKCCLKNETADEDGYHWCDLYIGDNYDDYVGTCACGLDDDDEVILEQIDELLNY